MTSLSESSKLRPRSLIFHLAALALLLGLDAIMFIRKMIAQRIGRVLLGFLLATMLLVSLTSLRSLIRINSDIRLMTDDALAGIESATKIGICVNDLRFELLHLPSNPAARFTQERMQAYASQFADAMVIYQRGTFLKEDVDTAIAMQQAQANYLAALAPLIKPDVPPTLAEIEAADNVAASLRQAVSKAAAFNRARLRTIVEEAQLSSQHTLQTAYGIWAAMAGLVAFVLGVFCLYIWIAPSEKPVK